MALIKENKMRKTLIGTLIACSLALATPAHAQWWGGGFGPGWGYGGWGGYGYGGWGYGAGMMGAAAGGALLGGIIGGAIANANRPVVYAAPPPVVVQPAPVVVEQRPVVVRRQCQIVQEWDAFQGYVYRKVCL